METTFTPWLSLAGGALIGLSAVVLMLTIGRVAGVSGIAARLLPAQNHSRSWALAFVVGLIVAMIVYRIVTQSTPDYASNLGLSGYLVAGLLVGFGAALGNGCTSGHGVCGLARLSVRSLVATVSFMATAIATVSIVRHVVG